MYRYGRTSTMHLDTLEPELRQLFVDLLALEVCDITIISGRRGEEEQNRLYRENRSQLQFPESRHNGDPNGPLDAQGVPYSLAVDAAPYPIRWKDRERATLFAGLVIGYARARGLALIWGGDWDRDFEVNDNHFDDLWHFQRVEWEQRSTA